jgi:transcriptional regulator with XRE-family HTH domain
METKDRIKIIRDYFCDGNNELFAGKIGEKPNTTSNWISRNPGSISVINKICQTFPELSIDWLLTGEGTMLKSETKESEPTTIKERLILFLSEKKLSQNKFEKAVGLSNGYVNNIRQSIQPDTLQRIGLIYPELNIGWLMTGEGSMLKGGELHSPSREKEKESLMQIIQSQQRTIEKLTDLLGEKKQGAYMAAKVADVG